MDNRLIIIGGGDKCKNFTHELAVEIAMRLHISYHESYSHVSVFIESNIHHTTDADDISFLILNEITTVSQSKSKLNLLYYDSFNMCVNNPPKQKKKRSFIPDKRSINRRNRKRKNK